MIEIAIIGAGPAGLSAGVSARARNKEVTIFGRRPETSLLYKAENINNYLGFENVTGEEMIDSFYNHAVNTGVKFETGRVINIQPFGDTFMLNVDNNIYEAKSVIIATGITKKSTIKNEDNYLGKGLSYCATCDGMFYRGKDVVIYGEIEEAEEDANFLSEICKSVTLVHSYNNLKHVNENVTCIKGKITEVKGDDKVEYVTINNGNTIDAEGLFIIKSSIKSDDLLDGLEMNGTSIKVDSLMHTNIDGVYACGDCIGTPYQVSKAVGDGLVAAWEAVKYISTNHTKNK